MSLADLFNFSSNSPRGIGYLPDVFPMAIGSNEFVKMDVVETYSKILIDVVERTQGIPEKLQPLLWDNCLGAEAGTGLVTMLAKAMEQKRDLYIVYKSDVGVIREANSEEQAEIREQMKSKGKSTTGIMVSFTNYKKTDILRFYSALEYCVIATLHKQMNLSRAIQYKYNDLRKSVSATDKKDVERQIKEQAEALALGKDIYLDAKDVIETAKVDMAPTESAMNFIDGKRCWYLGLPMSYIRGEQSKGMSDTGNADAKAIDRGLKPFYYSIVKPVVEAIFGVSTTFKPQDHSQISSGLEAIKTFALVDEAGGINGVSIEEQAQIVRRLMGL